MEANFMDEMDMGEAESGYDYDEDDQTPGSPKNKSILRMVLLILFVLLLVILVAILLFNIFFGGGDNIGQATPTPTPSPTSDGVDVIITVVVPTPTPTRVLNPTATSTVPPIPEPTDETTPAATEQTSAPDEFVPAPIVHPGIAVGELLENGDFETFGDGLGKGWTSFRNDNVIAVFSPEGPDGPYVESGNFAQRITMAEASQPDRYAGIYQQVGVIPGQVYSLTLYGQIRTGYADVNQSSYGYRLQYAIDHTGGDNWQNVPAAAWIELPWDEQQLHSPDVKFLSYTSTISATSDTITLFVRVWNKWANPAEVQYTLDSFSLVGASMSGGTDSQMIDKPLPITGENDPTGFVGSAPFWGALVVLALLAVGAIYRSKWST